MRMAHRAEFCPRGRETPNLSRPGLDRRWSCQSSPRAPLTFGKLPCDLPTGTPAKRKDDSDLPRQSRVLIRRSISTHGTRPPVVETHRTRSARLEIALSSNLGFQPM